MIGRKQFSLLHKQVSELIKVQKYTNHLKYLFLMQANTISVSPLPQSTSVDKIKQIFQAFSVKNVHIQGNTAYVEFIDQGDLENLDIQFDNYEVAELNNAKIDKAEFDWNSIKKNDNSPKQKSQSSEPHQDLMAADIDNLIVIQNCDPLTLYSLSTEDIRKIFKDFHSVNRIIKRNNDVIVEFTDLGQMEQLENKFNNFNVPQLGPKSQIQKADNTKINPNDFVNQWQKIHTQESMMTQPSTNLGYKDDKPVSGEVKSNQKFGYGSVELSPSPKVLHQEFLPTLDKQTSMEANFMIEQSKLGYQQEPKHESIPQATTHQQLDYTTQVKVVEDQNKLGYPEQKSVDIVEQENQRKRKQEEAHKKQEQERKRKQEVQAKRRQEEIQKQEQQRKRKQQQQHRLRIQQEQRKKRAEQEQRKKKAEQEQRKKQHEQLQKRKRQEEENQRKKQEQQRLKKESEEKKKRQEEEKLKRQSEEKKKREEQQTRKRIQEETKKRIQQERLSQQLKEKLQTQKQKFQSEIEKLGYEDQKKQQIKHEAPTESQNILKETEALRKAEESIEKQLGYAVNMAKAESAHLLQAGLDLLKGNQNETKEKEQEKSVKKTQKLGYEKQSPKQIGLNILNSGLDFLKGSYQKFQQHFGENAKQPQPAGSSKESELGYENWSVKPNVGVIKGGKEGQSRILRTLVTVSLLIWVIFLLMQDTGETIASEIEIGNPTTI